MQMLESGQAPRDELVAQGHGGGQAERAPASIPAQTQGRNGLWPTVLAEIAEQHRPRIGEQALLKGAGIGLARKVKSGLLGRAPQAQEAEAGIRVAKADELLSLLQPDAAIVIRFNATTQDLQVRILTEGLPVVVDGQFQHALFFLRVQVTGGAQQRFGLERRRRPWQQAALPASPCRPAHRHCSPPRPPQALIKPPAWGWRSARSTNARSERKRFCACCRSGVDSCLSMGDACAISLARGAAELALEMLAMELGPTDSGRRVALAGASAWRNPIHNRMSTKSSGMISLV